MHELAQHKLWTNDGHIGSLAQTHALSSLPKGGGSQARDFYRSFNAVLDLLTGTTGKVDGDYQFGLISAVENAIKGEQMQLVADLLRIYALEDNNKKKYPAINTNPKVELDKRQKKGRKAAGEITKIYDKYRGDNAMGNH